MGISEAFASLVVRADDSMPVIDQGPSSITVLLLRGPGMSDNEYDALYETSIESVELEGLKVEWIIRLPESVTEYGADGVDAACRFATVSTQCETCQFPTHEI